MPSSIFKWEGGGNCMSKHVTQRFSTCCFEDQFPWQKIIELVCTIPWCLTTSAIYGQNNLTIIQYSKLLVPSEVWWFLGLPTFAIHLQNDLAIVQYSKKLEIWFNLNSNLITFFNLHGLDQSPHPYGWPDKKFTSIFGILKYSHHSFIHQHPFKDVNNHQLERRPLHTKKLPKPSQISLHINSPLIQLPPFCLTL